MTDTEQIKPPERKKRIVELDDALARVSDGMTIAIGGFINSSHPMLVVRGLIKRGLKNLTIVGAASSGLEIDLLIAAGCARRVVAPYVGG
jgi:glutaconate CoA-transferase subunit A